MPTSHKDPPVPEFDEKMPHFRRQHWKGSPTAQGSRRARMSFDYEAFVPDPIARADWSFTTGTMAELELAARVVAMLEGRVGGAMVEALSRVLLRAESIASSRIEGLSIGNRRLAEALFNPSAGDPTAQSVLANVRAMEEGLADAVGAPPSVATLCRLNAVLLRDESPRLHPGELRSEPVWLGGNLPNRS